MQNVAMVVDKLRTTSREILARPYLAGWKDRDAPIFNTPGAARYTALKPGVDNPSMPVRAVIFSHIASKRLGLGA